MAVTNDLFFSSVVQTGAGFSWDFPSKVLSDATGQANSNADTQTLELNTPLAGAEIPVDQVITDIQLTVQWFRLPGADIDGELTIAGGTTNTFAVPEPPSSGIVYPGNLAYWGITEQQAADFAAGMGQDLDLRMVHNIGDVGVSCGWVKCLFTYEDAPPPPSSGLVFNPAVF